MSVEQTDKRVLYVPLGTKLLDMISLSAMQENNVQMIKGFEAIDLNNKRGVLLDLDNTLYPYKVNHHRALAATAERAQEAHQISKEEFDAAYAVGRKTVHGLMPLQAASHSRLLYFQRASEQLFGQTNIQFALEMEKLYWATFISGMELFPEAKAFLEKCTRLGLRTCIVTDLTAQVQMQKWKKLDLDTHIHFLLSSEEAGVEKPAPKMFELALEKVQLAAEDVIMIGDNLSKDVLGAQAIGIDAYHVVPVD